MSIDIEDKEQLSEYLSKRVPELAEGDETLEVTRLSGGVSNRTMLVNLSAGRSWVVKQALEKLRVPVDWHCDPNRIHREALGMQLLRRLLPAGTVPGLVFEDRQNHLIIMEAVREPFETWKRRLLDGRLAPGEIQHFARILASIHSGGARMLPNLAPELSDLSYFQALRLEPYYEFTAARLPEAAGLLNDLSEGYEREQHTLVHGDFSPKNILIRGRQMILLDHEVIHVGDPAFDLGFSLTHLLSKAHHLHELRSVFLEAARAYWANYRRAVPVALRSEWGGDFEKRVVRHTMACLLARAAGRSQLEYLTDGEKERQVAAVTGLLARRPTRVDELAACFGEAIEGREDGRC